MSSHSDAVSRIVLEFPVNRRASAPRPSTIDAHGSGVASAFAAMVSYMEILANRCIGAARPKRVGWQYAVADQAAAEPQSAARSLLRRVHVVQSEDLVELKVLRSGRRAKTV